MTRGEYTLCIYMKKYDASHRWFVPRLHRSARNVQKKLFHKPLHRAARRRSYQRNNFSLLESNRCVQSPDSTARNVRQTRPCRSRRTTEHWNRRRYHRWQWLFTNIKVYVHRKPFYFVRRSVPYTDENYIRHW